MSDLKIVNRVEDLRVMHQALCFDYAEVLQNLGDESYFAIDGSSGVALTMPIEKINYLIRELEKMKEETQWIDEVENVLFDNLD